MEKTQTSSVIKKIKQFFKQDDTKLIVWIILFFYFGVLLSALFLFGTL